MATSFKNRDWLARPPTPRFKPLVELSAQSIPETYLKARGAADELTMQNLVSEDFFHIAHALSLLFDYDSEETLQHFLGIHFPFITSYSHQIDHIGRELFGPLSFYLPLLKGIAPRLGLIYLSDFTFSSTTVAEELRQQDSHLKGVTIARIYFQSLTDNRIGCLELFQAAPEDEKGPQQLKATRERLSVLLDPSIHSTFSPIDHLSIRLDTLEAVQYVHHRIHQFSSDTFRCSLKEISRNHADGSVYTKALMRDSDTSAFNRILEFVHYTRL